MCRTAQVVKNSDSLSRRLGGPSLADKIIVVQLELQLDLMAPFRIHFRLVNVLLRAQRFATYFLLTCLFLSSLPSLGQALGNAGSIEGQVLDPSGSAVVGATVTLRDPVTGYARSILTGNAGSFRFTNVPFSSYELTTRAAAFQTAQRSLEVRSSVPVTLEIGLTLPVSQQSVEVHGETRLVDSAPTAHTDLDSSRLAKLPLETATSQLTIVLTQTVPGVALDSNGQFHPTGEEGDSSFVVDNQPVSDQQGRMFGNQIPLETAQSFEVIEGVPPAEFGDKNSLVIRTLTRSGLGLTKPTGSLSFGYGSFGTSTASAALSVGNQKLGNFVFLDGLETGRFLDSPEFLPFHDKGNAENLFDGFDYQVNRSDTLHLNLSLARSWFQVPNTYPQAFAGQDQRQLLRSFNFAPGYTHLFNPSTLLSVNAWARQQRVSYFPTSDRFADQPATLSQSRRLTNAGIRTDLSYLRGIHNLKAGVQFQHYFLSEAFTLGLTDPLYNAVCVDSGGAPVAAPGITNPANCGPMYSGNPDFLPGLLPYDLTRAGQLFDFRGTTDIKQEAAYVEDTLTLRQFSLMLGLRADQYNGLSSSFALQPRLGASYLVSRTQTVLRASYGRLFETPYNENLIVSSSTGSGGLAGKVLGAAPSPPITPGIRNQFNVGLQQAVAGRLVIDGDYVWKFTDSAYDSDALLDTPLVFPTSWRKAKTDGANVRVTFPARRGFSASSVLGHVRARFFGPETGGILFNTPPSTAPFRIDQDQAFQQATHVQYQFRRPGPWVAFTWRYDSGMVASSVPTYADALTLTPDQQAAIGLYCGSVFATLSSPIRSCSAPRFGATRVVIPRLGTENPDLNPPRLAPRHVFDIGSGLDNVLRRDKYNLNLRFSVLNLGNAVALYNFLSDFSGTHFLAPRSYQAEAKLSF